MAEQEDGLETTGPARSITVRMPCRLGLHARTAARFLSFVKPFQSDIRIRLGSVEVDGKSILGLIMLGAGWGCLLQIEAEGCDAEEAIRQIGQYFSTDEHCADD